MLIDNRVTSHAGSNKHEDATTESRIDRGDGFEAPGTALAQSSPGVRVIALLLCRDSAAGSDPQRAAETPRGVVRVSPVVINKDMIITAITEKSAAKLAYPRRGLYPT